VVPVGRVRRPGPAAPGPADRDGIAFGALIQASAPAIVIYFVLPTALGALGALNAIEAPMRWLNTEAIGRLNEDLLSGAEWARVATATALWVLLPLAAGAWRIARENKDPLHARRRAVSGWGLGLKSMRCASGRA
jgi:hypothetical protein